MNIFETLVATHKFDLKFPVKLEFTRDHFAEWLGQAGFMSGAEIGVERGLYSDVLLSANPEMTLYMVDPWAAYSGYRDHVSQEKFDRFFKETQERTKKYSHAEIIRKYSMDAVKTFPDNSLDFVYIDANHEFLNITQDIFFWEKKVRHGGIVAGHDFRRNSHNGYINHVKDVVQAWTYTHSIKPWFITSGDKSPSWFWIKK